MKRFGTLLFSSIIVFLFLFTTLADAKPPEDMVVQTEHPDGDADGVLNKEDVCPDTLPGDAANEHGCSVDDHCPCDYPWKNHGEYVSCITRTSQDFVKAGLITNKEKSDNVSEAANGCSVLGLPNYTNYGDPNHPPIKLANDTFEISFVVTGDPQLFDLYTKDPLDPIPIVGPIGYCSVYPEKNLLRSQKTVKEINKACKNADPECMGAFVAGDLTQQSKVQQIIAFRQLFEYEYPGEEGGSIACYEDDYYHRYSWGYNVGYPMYTLIGNHGDPTEDDHTEHVQDYINDLVMGHELYEFPIEKQFAGTAPSSAWGGNYAWEWGSFNFISLGLWAFYAGYDGTHTSVDQYKTDWLKEYLASIGHERAIVLFQHVGWDGFSFKRDDDGTPMWWSHDNAELLINVICNRESSDEPCGTEEKPRYNVIGIFSGHTHVAKHKTICAERDGDDNCVVEFDNYIVNDAGPGGDDDATGFTMVHLNVWPEGYPRHTENQMTVTNRNLTNFDYAHVYDGYGDGYNNSTYDLVTHSTHTRTGITTGFTTWDQGEPNGGARDNCASFKSNGRLNDLDCTSKLRFVCREIDPDYPSISELHLLTGEDTGEWGHGEFVCEDSGENRSFSLPKSLEEQLDLMQLIIDSGNSSPVWVNKSDQIKEGHWIVYPQDYFYFEQGQPNDGSQIPQWKGHGEDCAVINKDGLLEDRRCENELHNYVCKDHDGWYIHPEKGMWKQAFDDDKCGEQGFPFPANGHEYQKMVNDLKTDLQVLGSAWISLNDITEEGNWVSVVWSGKCWGDNASGQTILPYDTFRQITTGDNFTCGIQLDGTMECWGDDFRGQLLAPSGVFLQIDAGNYHTCGVRGDKTVSCWGWDLTGQSDAPSGKFQQVSAGWVHTCGILNDGTLTCWGQAGYGLLDAPSGKFHQIDAGYYHTCGVRIDKTVVCWGADEYGQLTAPSGEFRQVSVGKKHACGVREDGTAACWGDNSYSQLDTPPGPFLKIDAGYDHTCGLAATLPQSQFEGHWKLDEGSGTIVTDSSPNGYDGLLRNSPSWSRDIPRTNFDNSHSLRFKRADQDYVSIPTTTNIDNLDQFSLSIWVKLTAMPDDSIMRFVTLGNEKASLRYDGQGAAGGPGQLHFYMQDDSGTFHNIRKDGALSTGHWYHIVGTYDGSSMRLYLNGVEQGYKDVSVTPTTGHWVTMSRGGDETLEGRLDDIRVYNRAIVPSEIRLLTAGNQAGSGTLACWGDNFSGQLDAPLAAFDQVSAGGSHTCSIKSFIRPWEDDFATGEKNNDAEDCTYLETYLEDGRQTGKLYDTECVGVYKDHAACKSTEAGDWKITSQPGMDWSSGFNNCAEESGENEWRFDAPISEADNDRLIAATWEQFGENKTVWVNYSDVRIEGLWRHAYWENWQEMPQPGFGNCAALDLNERTWLQRDCDDWLDIVCDYGYGSHPRYYLPLRKLAGWEDANSVCSSLGAAPSIPLPQSYSEQLDLINFVKKRSPSASYIWIRYTDLDHEGHWEDWVYGD